MDLQFDNLLLNMRTSPNTHTILIFQKDKKKMFGSHIHFHFNDTCLCGGCFYTKLNVYSNLLLAV